MARATHRARPITKAGKHGTLFLYAVKYTDVSGEDPVFRTRMWAYNEEHLLDRFYSDPDDGWEIVSIARETSAPEHRWNWHRP